MALRGAVVAQRDASLEMPKCPSYHDLRGLLGMAQDGQGLVLSPVVDPIRPDPDETGGPQSRSDILDIKLHSPVVLLGLKVPQKCAQSARLV